VLKPTISSVWPSNSSDTRLITPIVSMLHMRQTTSMLAVYHQGVGGGVGHKNYNKIYSVAVLMYVNEFGPSCPWLVHERFRLLLHAFKTVCHETSLQHHLYRLSDKKAEADPVQPQFSVIIIHCSLQLRFVLVLTVFGFNTFFVN